MEHMRLDARLISWRVDGFEFFIDEGDHELVVDRLAKYEASTRNPRLP